MATTLKVGTVRIYVRTTFYNFHGCTWLSGVALRYLDLFCCLLGHGACTAISLGVILQFYVAAM